MTLFKENCNQTSPNFCILSGAEVCKKCGKLVYLENHFKNAPKCVFGCQTRRRYSRERTVYGGRGSSAALVKIEKESEGVYVVAATLGSLETLLKSAISVFSVQVTRPSACCFIAI